MSNLDPLSRREFVRNAAVASGCVAWIADQHAVAAPPAAAAGEKQLTADESLRDLLEGNVRFAEGRARNPRRTPKEFAAGADIHLPQAIIVGCADARVPPEVLFDQGVGDLFVVRVAGNIINGAGATVKGSIEYAVLELGVPLIVVLGHAKCGAVKAAIKHLDANDTLPGAIEALVQNIKPTVASIKNKPGDLLENAIRANVAAGVQTLKELDPIVAPAVREGRLRIVGATYDLRAGRVALVA